MFSFSNLKDVRGCYELGSFNPIGYRRYPLRKKLCRSISTSNKGFRSNDNLADLFRVRNGYFRSFEDVIVIDFKQNRELLDAFIYAGYINS